MLNGALVYGRRQIHRITTKKNIIKILLCACAELVRRAHHLMQTGKMWMVPLHKNTKRATENHSSRRWNFCAGFCVYRCRCSPIRAICFLFATHKFLSAFLFLSDAAAVAAFSWNFLLLFCLPLTLVLTFSFIWLIPIVLWRKKRSHEVWLQFNSNWIDFFSARIFL